MSYITDLETVDEVSENHVEVSGHDMQSLLYNFMDEFLFQVKTHPASLIPYASSIIPHPSSRIPHPLSLIHHPSSRIPHPLSLIPHP